jgi:hypothetical protein
MMSTIEAFKAPVNAEYQYSQNTLTMRQVLFKGTNWKNGDGDDYSLLQVLVSDER